eukprot:CAMPEP_0194249430 /NCGR_PEP_ID=MMETSP0158-20130606/20457_1 /TAXON_ID=33649 /ORGANISM="Thalassionema nitzschioides, Strain L26-B" /LENGTH=568 /DNA_ID=CAMNT_0038985947 /DNA_START=392 /DNA_END=2098 /DNA_ORIENTATION=+
MMIALKKKTTFIALLASSFLIATSLASSTCPDGNTLTPTQDTHISSSQGFTVFGSSDMMSVSDQTLCTPRESAALLQFDLTGITSSSSISCATLRLWVSNNMVSVSNGVQATIGVYRLQDGYTWSESSLTYNSYNSAPPTKVKSSTQLYVNGSTDRGQWVTVSIDDILANAAGTIVTLFLETDSFVNTASTVGGCNNVAFASKDRANFSPNHPELIVTSQQDPGTNGDPIILGFRNQVFQFDGQDGAWYANLAIPQQQLQWNMQFQEYPSCPPDENMFVSGLTFSLNNNNNKSDDDNDLKENENTSSTSIMIITTPEAIEECRSDPDAVCLGEGTLHLSFDGGKTFVSNPGDYHFGKAGNSRVVAHNTYAACSRKWHDYEVSRQDKEGKIKNRLGGRRTTVHDEKKPLQLLSDQQASMIDPKECQEWMDDRLSKNDVFQQKGHWSTLYIETEQVSFHVEYRRSDWFQPACDFQSLDAWMTKVSDEMESTSEWSGILGETKYKIYDATSGEQIMADRSLLLRGKDDADYEVSGPFGTEFQAASNTPSSTTTRVVKSLFSSKTTSTAAFE